MRMKPVFLVGLLTSGLLAGCGSDSDNGNGGFDLRYSGVEIPGVINDESKASFETAAVESVKSILISYETSDFIPMGVELAPSLSDENKALLLKIANSIKESHNHEQEELPVGVEVMMSEDEIYEENIVIDETGSCNGTLAGTLTGFDNYLEKPFESGYQESGDFVYNFSQYCNDEYSDDFYIFTMGYIFDGNMSGNYNFAGSGPEDYSYSDTTNLQNFTVSDEEGKVLFTINGTMVSEGSQDGNSSNVNLQVTIEGVTFAASYTEVCNEEFGCTGSETYMGANGVAYKVEETDINSTPGGYTIEAVIFEPTFGSVAMAGYDLELCEGENGFELESGEIALLDEEGSQQVISVDACGVYSSEVSELPELQEPM